MLLEILLITYVTTYVAKNKHELGIPKVYEAGKKAAKEIAGKINQELEKRKPASDIEKKISLNEALEKVLIGAPPDEINTVVSLLEKYAVNPQASEVK